MAKFLIDQNIPQGVINWLIKQRFDVKLVKNIDPEMSDSEVVEICRRENRVLLTNDKDFVGLCVGIKSSSCVIFRMQSQSSFIRIKALDKILPEIKKGKNLGIVMLE